MGPFLLEDEFLEKGLTGVWFCIIELTNFFKWFQGRLTIKLQGQPGGKTTWSMSREDRIKKPLRF
jgi:hypothetical protein